MKIKVTADHLLLKSMKKMDVYNKARMIIHAQLNLSKRQTMFATMLVMKNSEISSEALLKELCHVLEIGKNNVEFVGKSLLIYIYIYV